LLASRPQFQVVGLGSCQCGSQVQRSLLPTDSRRKQNANSKQGQENAEAGIALPVANDTCRLLKRSLGRQSIHPGVKSISMDD
jgi:hypothetical protein